MHRRISLILKMIITHGKTMMHIQHGWTLAVFSAASLVPWPLLAYAWIIYYGKTMMHMMHVHQVYDMMLNGWTPAVFQCCQPHTLKSLCLRLFFGYACMDFIHFTYEDHPL